MAKATGIGPALRRARLVRGKSIGEASRETRIRAEYLQALERERFDNLLGDDPETERQMAETRSVLAHELGHHASGDLWRMSAASAVGTAIALAAVAAALTRLPDALAHRSAGVFAMLPALFVCAALVQIVAGVALGAYSRRRERAADAYGVELIGDGEPFARAMENLCATNLAELRPPRLEQWLGASHPPPYERIARARSRGKENPTPGANGAL